MNHVFIFISTLLIISCANSNTNIKINHSSQQNNISNDTTTLPKNSDDIDNVLGDLENGKTDTLIINGNQYRLHEDSQSDSIILEYKINKSWIENTSFDLKDQFEIDVDYNHDGYNDISCQSQGWSFINFYLPEKQIFSKQFQLPGDNELLLDSINKLYINYREPYHECDNYISQLLDYKNGLPNFYFLLSGESSKSNGDCNQDSIAILKLYKIDSSSKSNPVLLKTFKPNNPAKFEYIEFWKENYQTLIFHK